VLVEHGGGDVTRYLHLPHSIATDDGKAWTYSAADGLGSVRQQLDESGQVVSVNSYRPFGSPLEGEGGAPYGFTGEWWEDDAGLLFLRARYLQPETGRFISQDIWPGNLKLSQTLNRFVYVENNPATGADPSGYAVDWGANTCSEPRCFVFYFPGTEKVDSDYRGSGEYYLASTAGFGADASWVIFPFYPGGGYPGALKEYMRGPGSPLFSNKAQQVQLNAIKNDHFRWLFPIKAQEIREKVNRELIDSGALGALLEIDFVAHSGGSHIALNTARFMPEGGFKVDDVVALGGLFKAHEWKETGRLDSVNNFYDILSHWDYVQAVRNGWFGGFNYTAWHGRWCDESCLAEQLYSLDDLECCTSGFGDLSNAERIPEGGGHSDYWTDADVRNHLFTVLCENKR